MFTQNETAKRHYTSLNTLYRITFNRRSIDEDSDPPMIPSFTVLYEYSTTFKFYNILGLRHVRVKPEKPKK